MGDLVEELRPIPESISHKMLNALINNAKKESKFPEDGNSNSSNIEFEELLLSWEKLSESVIKKLNDCNFNFKNKQSPKALMALGAMEVHINLAIKALKASQKE